MGFHVGDTQVLYELSVIHFLYPNVHLSYQGGGGGGEGEKGGCVSVRATGNTPEYGPIFILFPGQCEKQ